jgi:selenide,water dikinase
MGLVPAGTYANRDFCQQSLMVDPAIPFHILDILADAQTSGGLLISVRESRAAEMLEKLQARGIREAAVIGEVTAGPPGTITVLP